MLLCLSLVMDLLHSTVTVYVQFQTHMIYTVLAPSMNYIYANYCRHYHTVLHPYMLFCTIMHVLAGCAGCTTKLIQCITQA
jgi:hypothetical protein